MALRPVSGFGPSLPCSMETFLDEVKLTGDPNFADANGRTALGLAIKEFQSPVQLVDALLKLGADPNAKSWIGGVLNCEVGSRFAITGTALYAAVEAGNLAVVKLLLDNGADPNSRTSTGKTPLQLGLHYGERISKDENLELVKLLVEAGGDTSITDSTERTVLHQATSLGDDGVVCYLLSVLNTKCVPAIDSVDIHGQTALHYAHDNPRLTEILLRHGANPNVLSSFGETPYIKACLRKNLEVMKILHEYDADPNIADERGFTALHKGVSSNRLNEELVRLLLEHNASRCATDNSSRTPHYYFKFSGSDVGRIFCLLTQPGVNLSIVDSQNSLIHSVTSHFLDSLTGLSEMDEENTVIFEQVVQALVHAGADVNGKDSHNRTALHLIAAYGMTYCAEMLLRFHADVNARDCDGNTPVHIAAKHSYMEVMQVLLTSRKARADIPNNKKETVNKILEQNILRLESLVKSGVTSEFVNISFWSREKREISKDIATLADLKVLSSRSAQNLLHQPDDGLSIPKEDGNNLVGASFQPWNMADVRKLTEQFGVNLPHFLCLKENKPNYSDVYYYRCPDTDETSGYNDFVISVQERFPNLSSCISKYCQQYSVSPFHMDESCDDENCYIAHQVRSLVEDLVEKCAEIDPGMKCQLNLAGSTAEGTKMWVPDEFDFLMELAELSGKCDIVGPVLEHSGNKPRLAIRNELKPMWQDLLDSEGYLSSEKLRNYVSMLAAVCALSLQQDKYPNLNFNLCNYHEKSCKGCCNDQPLVKYSKVGVLLYLQWSGSQYKKLNINVDITPAIKYECWPVNDTSLPSSLHFLKELGCHVVPIACPQSGPSWRLSFCKAELQVFQKLSVLQLNIYKALKLLRDIHAKDGSLTSSYLLKTMLFNYIFKQNPDWQIEDVRYHAVRLIKMVSRVRPIPNFFINSHSRMEPHWLNWCHLSLKLLTQD